MSNAPKAALVLLLIVSKADAIGTTCCYMGASADQAHNGSVERVGHLVEACAADFSSCSFPICTRRGAPG